MLNNSLEISVWARAYADAQRYPYADCPYASWDRLAIVWLDGHVAGLKKRNRDQAIVVLTPLMEVRAGR
jgi:prepilin-type processing-associated H-X9-DG protein